MNPREKKDRDLSGHCKNRYGNSDKAARSGVRRKKRTTTHRARREASQTMNQMISAQDPDEVESGISSVPPLGSNAKWPDTRMGEILQDKIRGKIRKMLPESDGGANTVSEFQEWCRSSGKQSPVHIDAWGRYLRAVASIGMVPIPKISATDQRDLYASLIAFTRRQDNQSEQADAGNRRPAGA